MVAVGRIEHERGVEFCYEERITKPSAELGKTIVFPWRRAV